MKKTYFETSHFYGLCKGLFTVFALLMFHSNANCNHTKTNPTQVSRALVFSRAASLDNGISISWLEQTWDNSALNKRPVAAADFVLLKKLGFKSIRLPVAFEYWQSKKVPVAKLYRHIDWVLNQCKTYSFKLIIDYHSGNINDQNYTAETQSAITTWQQVIKRYAKVSSGLLFYEIYNEPPHMDPQRWKDAAYNIVSAIRKIDQEHTLLVGASNFNSIYELSRFVRLADENIIYSFHFYEPFLFTHQGAAWVGDQVTTTGVTFPYDGENFPRLNPKAKGTWGETNYYQYKNDGNAQSLMDKLKIVKAWADRYDVPLVCSEYGAYNKYADLDSRCRYITAMRHTLRVLKIPGLMWDYNSNFSIFTGKPATSTLPLCMRNALQGK